MQQKKNKYLLEIEFRYRHIEEYEYDSGHRFKTIAIGIYDTRGEAVSMGNEVLKTLSKYFKSSPEDRFDAKNNLVTNLGYPTKGITYFLSIRELCFADLTNVVKEVFEVNNIAITQLKNMED